MKEGARVMNNEIDENIPVVLAADDLVQMAEMYKDGLRARDIAKYFNIHPSTVWRYLKKNNLITIQIISKNFHINALTKTSITQESICFEIAKNHLGPLRD